MADIALSALGLVASIPASIDSIIELARKSSVLSSNRLNALTGWENLGHDFSSLQANAKYLKENCSKAEEHLFRMQLEVLNTKLCALKNELENVENIVQRRRTRIFPSTLKNEMEAVAEHLREVHGILGSIREDITDRRKRERNADEDFFVIGQNLAEKPKGVEVLDFDTRDENGKRETMEGQLLDAVLALDGLKKITATSQGYGGVGKSCALRGIAQHVEIQNRFWGGILFVTLGQEAGEESLKDHLRWMVQITGGKEKAKEVAAETLERSVQATGTWFSEYPCLFLFDDVWCGKTLSRAAINSLRSIARHQQSRLVFTTRQVSFESDVTIRFKHRPTESEVSRNILLSTAGFDREPKCPSALEAFHKLLRVARGLPLRLALIGGGVRKMADLYDDIKRDEAWKLFNWGEAENASIEEKDILLRSLSYMDGGDSERFYYKCFMSLCVLRYAQSMPVRVVSQLWGLSETEGQKSAEALADVNIVRMSRGHTGQDWGDMMTVGLHDIMLEVARKETQKDESDVCYASRLINSYLRMRDGEESETVCGSFVMWCENEIVDVGIDVEGFIYTKNVSEGDGHVYQAVASSDIGEVARGRWRVVNDDGYVYKNFCWLLKCAKLKKELFWLISQPSWLIGQMDDFGFGQAEDDSSLSIQFMSDVSRLSVSEDTIQSVKLLKSAVALCKGVQRADWWRGFYWFQMYGRLLCFANQSEWVRNYIQKIEQVAPRPWYRPSVGCLAPADNSVHTVLPIDNYPGVFLDGNDLTYWSFASGARDVEINTYSLSEECEKEKWVLKSDEIDDWIKVIDCDVEESARISDVNSSSSEPSSSNQKEKWNSRVKKLLSRSLEKDESQSEVNIESVFDEGGQTRRSDDAIEILEVVVSRDSKNVVACMIDGSVRLWTLQDEKWNCTTFTGHSDEVCEVGIGKDGTRFVSVSSDETMRFWFKRGDGNWYSTVNKELHSINLFEMSADGNCVVVVSGTESESTIYVVQLGERGKVMKLEELSESIGDVAINKTGTCVSALLENGGLYVWIYDEGNWRKTVLEGGGRIYDSVAINGDGNCVVTSHWHGMEVWQLEGGTWHRKVLKGNYIGVECVAVNEAGTFFCGFSYWSIYVWEDLKAMDNLPPEKEIVSEGEVSLVETNNRIVGCHENRVMIWEFERKKWKRTVLEHSSRVFCVGSNGSGSCVACGSGKGTVQIWRLENGEWCSTFLKKLGDRSSDVFCVNINEAGSCVVAGIEKYSTEEYVVLVLKLIDDEWQEIELGGHTHRILCLKINAAGNLVVSGSRDKSVRLWELKDGKWTGTIVGEHTDFVWSVAANENGTRIVSTSNDDAVRVWAKKSDTWESTVLKCDLDGYCFPTVDISKCEKFILCMTFRSEVFAWRQVEEKWESTDSPNGVFSERWARQAARYRFPDLWQNEIIKAICNASGGEIQYEIRGSYFLTVPREPYLVRVDEIQ